MAKRLPPSIGLEVNKPLLYNPYQQAFLHARRQRYCATCKKIGLTGDDGLFVCPVCKVQQLEAARVFKRLGIFAGRRGGKSLVGAHGAREEMQVPNSLGWVCGPTYKILRDATMPTLLKLIPVDWVADWSEEELNLTLKNGAMVSFRSLDDPDRGHAGVGLHWAWLDEAAFINSLAWDFLRPALTDYGGAAFFTSSVDGFDWTYDRIEKPALIDKKPGFWAAKYRTIDNPWIASRHADEVDEARDTMPPQLFRQEYEGVRENFTGSVFGEWIDTAWLPDDLSIKDYIPEWDPRKPNFNIDPSRRVIVPLDSGADHPFGAMAMVVTERGIVVVKDYLERQRAIDTHLESIRQFPLGSNPLWTANKNEAQLRLEFAQRGILLAPAENEHKAGIQRVLSWLYTRQLKIAYTCPRTFNQMKKYRYDTNILPDGQKREKEKVFKKEDELPDCVRYGVMTWPSLPRPEKVVLGRDTSSLDEKTISDIERMKAHLNQQEKTELQVGDVDYPVGQMFDTQDSTHTSRTSVVQDFF